MRSDVLNLILGWTPLALLVPLGLCGIITALLDGYACSAGVSSCDADKRRAGSGHAWPVHANRFCPLLRDLEAFVGVGLVWPLTVFIGALPYWFGVFVGPPVYVLSPSM